MVLLYKPFYRSGLSANKITVFNFLTLGLGSVALFSMGIEGMGLLTAGLAAMVDYIDGTIARARGGSSSIGAYLDTSLDWLWLMLLIGAISYHHEVMTIGYLALVAITFGNWVQYNGKVNIVLPFPLGVSHLMVLGILLRHAEWGITGIMLTQGARTALMYWRSVYGNNAKNSDNNTS
jgi:phosphatidylglycerophosphate synthase